LHHLDGAFVFNGLSYRRELIILIEGICVKELIFRTGEDEVRIRSQLSDSKTELLIGAFWSVCFSGFRVPGQESASSVSSNDDFILPVDHGGHGIAMSS
jgi:hypothetical protein